MKVQLRSGAVYEMNEHKLSERQIETDWGPGKVLGIRANAKSARVAYAFIVQLGPLNGSTYLMSRGKFKLVQ